MTDQKQPLTGPEIIERVRIEIQHINLSREHNTDIAYRAVLTVLDAIREPREAALHAGGEEIEEQYEAHSDWEEAKDMAEDLDVRPIFQRMIDALRREIAG